MTPKRLVRALAEGSTSVLTAATTCATAGIIVGVVTLTGLGQKFSDIVIDYAGGSLLLTALYTALVVWIVGLAVPVTASYIICAVIAAPAMIKLGVRRVAAHMFIFYYSVLSEVSPPTALSPFAAAAITGGDPYRTTLQAWKYTLPGVPGAVRLRARSAGHRASAQGPEGRLLGRHRADHRTKRRSVLRRWRRRRRAGRSPQDHAAERLLCWWCGLLLVFPSLLEALVEAIIGRDIGYTATFGMVIAAAVLLKQCMLPALPEAPATSQTKGGSTTDETQQALMHSRAGNGALRWSPAPRLRSNMNIAIATGGTGGVYYPLGGGMANVLSKYVPGVAGDRAGHRRLGRQPQAHRFAAERGRAGDGRRRARCAQGRGQVQGQPGRRCAR